jgi:hypothetical protein
MKLRRFWIEFELSDADPWQLRRGCGVTAYSLDDARRILRKQAFEGRDLPAIRRIVEDVDVSTLDAHHIRPNMAPPNWRGVWYPQGYSAVR